MITKRIRVLPYSSASASAKIIAEVVGGKRIRLENSDYEFSPGDLVINWGNGWGRDFPGQLNPRSAVNTAINKQTFFCRLRSCGVSPAYYPRFWVSGDEIPVEAFPVIARTDTEDARGESAHFVESPDLLPGDWKLASEFLPKTREYRIHVGRTPSGESVGLAALWLLRYNHCAPAPIQNYKNGYFHSKIEPEAVPGPVLQAATEVFPCLGLDFCALDIGYNDETGVAKVFEANTAPCIEHEHVRKGYKKFFELFQKDGVAE